MSGNVLLSCGMTSVKATYHFLFHCHTVTLHFYLLFINANLLSLTLTWHATNWLCSDAPKETKQDADL